MPDEDGIEVPDADEACAQAVVAAGEALRDKGRTFWNSGDWLMEIIDETGAPICALRFSAGGGVSPRAPLAYQLNPRTRRRARTAKWLFLLALSAVY
jgi:hypothetical protein